MKVTMEWKSFIYNLYLSIVFTLYKVEDKREIKKEFYENVHIEIMHPWKIIISDNK